MKHLLFFAGHRSGGRAERFKKMENNSFKNLFGKKTMIFITLLTLFLGFTTNAWAGKGFWTDGAWNIKYYDGGSSDKWFTDGQKMGATVDLGTLTIFYLKGCWVKTWADDNWTTNNCTVYYWIDGGDAGSNYTLNWGDSKDNPRTWNWETTGSFNEYNVIEKATNNGANPGVYTLKLKWNLDGGYSESSACGVKFTYPGFTTTSTSKDFGTVTVNSASSTSKISFGTHYGTALTTGNCSSLTDFVVTAIDESGVTVKFAPKSAGNKTETLTITDAHGKTCTITLKGKTQYAVTYKKGSFGTGNNVTNYKVYGTNLTLLDKGSFTRTGYVQTAWNTDADGTSGTSYDLKGTYTSEAALTLYPTWQVQTHTVTFGVGTGMSSLGSIHINVDGGADITTSPQEVGESSKIVFTASPITGYHVAGWYSDAACSQEIAGAGTGTSYTITSLAKAETVYVKFEANKTTITLNRQSGTGGSSSVTATYDAAMPTATMPTRIGYTFNGYYDATSGGTQYYTNTGASARNWDKPEASITLYAQWTEKIYSGITVVSNNTDKGTVDVSTATFGYTTGQQIIASHKAGYYLKDWTLPANATITSTESTATTTTITVKASGDADVIGKITANFAERWVLRGSKKNSAAKGGMPADDAAGLMTTVTDGVASIVVTLEPNIDYQFKIFDKKSNSEKGQKNEAILPPMTEDKSRWTLDGTSPVYLATVGHEQYTIYVAVDEENPKVYYSAPPSYQITMGTKTTSEGCAAATPGNGGNLTAEDGDHFPISDGKYVKNNGSVTFTATSNPGYSFAGFYSDAACTSTKLLSDENPYTISNISTNTAVYAKFTENLTDVTVFDGVNTTTVQAGVASHPQIVAQDVDGRKFTGWSCEGVSVENTKAKTTNINSVTTTINTHKVTATYGELDAIYFDISNATQWTAYDPSDMWVFFYAGAYWSDQDGTGTTTGGSYKGDFVKMERVNSNDCSFWVAYYDADKIQSWGSVDHVAFADHYQASGPFSSETTVSYFDFNHCMNTCVLSNNNGKSVTNPDKAYYRNEGFWKNYNAESSGLYLKMEKVTGDGGQEITTKVSADTYSISLHLNTESAGYSTYDYYFYISSCDGTNFTRNSGQITAENPKLNLCDRGTNIPGNKVTLHATATGSYTMLVTHKNDNTLDVTVEYPVSVGDFRVVSVIGGDAHDNGYLYKSSTTGTEMASFYVTNGATVKLQKCTAISGSNVTWTDVTGQSISNFTTSEYRNFKITHNGANAALADVGEYEGKFYLRTDVAPGGWSNYLTNAGNIIQENEYGMNDAQSFKFTHSYTNHVGAGGNVKFVIANDYSKCITDTLAVDDFIEDAAGNLPSGKDANVRFMWNKNNNTVARAYIGGSANTQDRYLILLGNKKDSKSLMVDENGNAFPAGGDGRTGLHADEAFFKDLGNWVYQVNIKAFSGAAVKLMADFAGKTQYFVGAEGDATGSWRTIMAGSETETPYTMRAVYDFKSNRLVAGFVPDGNDISSQIVLNGDLLILREEQQSAKQIKFGAAAEGKTPSISAIDHIYCGLQINKNTMLGAHNSDYAKTMFWVSFPFEVNINEIFGVDGYGTKWIIQKYNGQKRADIGWFKGDGTETFWEFMEYEDQLEAYEGYLFMIDANYFDETTDDVWKIATVDHVTFYFPSADGSIGIVQKDNFEQDVPERPCGINREFEGVAGETLNHMNTDSHWNVIGVPAFQNKTMALGTETKTDMKAIYEWNSTNNSYNVKALNTQFEFRTMYSYMAQFGGKINWTDVSVVSNQAPYQYADNKNYMVDLFFGNGEAEDHTYINLADGASTDFVLNEDMMKIDNSGQPNIYSFAGAYDVAYNETTFDNQSVMLGVSAPKNGSYTFAMPKDFSGKAVLVDLESGEATDLNLSDYTVELNKGTYNNRFQLLLEVEAKAPTAIDNAKGEWSVDGKTKKLFINDNIYLINAGRIYNVLGVGE